MIAKLRLKLLKTKRGFTLLEVLVSILIATTFVAVSLQAMAIAIYARIYAKEQSDATLLIQEDLETVKNQATQPITGNRCQATSQTAGFADGLRDLILGSDLSTTSSTTNSTKILSATNKQYKLQRNMTFSNNAPFNVLQLKYEVIDEEPNPDRTVAELYIEVMPDAALQC